MDIKDTNTQLKLAKLALEQMDLDGDCYALEDSLERGAPEEAWSNPWFIKHLLINADDLFVQALVANTKEGE